MAQGGQPRTDPALTSRKPRSRIGLFLPYILLLLVAVLWSVGWIWVRSFAVRELDGWTAREAAAGREWTCDDRSVTGYPFRLELRCSSLKFARSDGSFTLGPVTAVVQIYDPRHGVLEATGPFHTEQGDLVGDATWTSLEASFHGASDGFVRASLVVNEPKASVKGAVPEPIDFSTKHLELHARPSPGRLQSEGAVDVSLRAIQAVIPQLDALSGSKAPADIAFDGTLEQAAGIGTGTLARELERWRAANGKLAVNSFSVAKGERRIQAKGEVGLDVAHRPVGQFAVRAAGLEDLIGQAMGQKLGADKGRLIGSIVGSLLGGLQRGDGSATASADPQTGSTGEPLKALPSLRLAGGRVLLGPVAVPNVSLPSLY